MKKEGVGERVPLPLPLYNFGIYIFWKKLRWQTCQNILFCLLGHIFFCLLCTFVSFSNYIFLHREIPLDCTSPYIMQNLLKLVVNVLKICRTLYGAHLLKVKEFLQFVKFVCNKNLTTVSSSTSNYDLLCRLTIMNY